MGGLHEISVKFIIFLTKGGSYLDKLIDLTQKQILLLLIKQNIFIIYYVTGFFLLFEIWTISCELFLFYGIFSMRLIFSFSILISYKC